jgi:lipopolysaccharide heptosyltransferase II
VNPPDPSISRLSGQPVNRHRFPNVLLIRPRKIGDVVLCTPLFRALRKELPAARISFLTGGVYSQLLEENPHLDEVIPYPTDGHQTRYLCLARYLRRQRYDAVIDCFSSPATARLAWFAHAPHRIGQRLWGRAWAYTDPVSTESTPRFLVQSLGDLLAPLGIPVGDVQPELHLSPERVRAARERLKVLGVKPGEFLVALVPGAEERAKLWPPERYAWIADWLIAELGARILLLHGPGEQALAMAVRQAMKEEALPPVPAVQHLGDLAALISACRLYVGADVGTRHIAIALGVPTIGIFGRAFAESWTPPDHPLHIALHHDPGCKSDCSYPRCHSLACVQDIPVKWVRDAVLALLPVLRLRSAETPLPAARQTSSSPTQPR